MASVFGIGPSKPCWPCIRFAAKYQCHKVCMVSNCSLRRVEFYMVGGLIVLFMLAESQASAASAVEDTVAVAHLLKAAAYNRCGAPGEALTASLAYLASPSGSVEDQQLAYAQLALHAAEHRSYSAAARVQALSKSLCET